MKFQTLASGSKGNSAIVICDNIKLLIDDGISYLSLKRKLENLSLTFDDLTGILITHSHSDHIKGLQSLIKHTHLKVMIPEKMYEDLSQVVPKNRVIYLKDTNILDQVTINLIHTSHDVACSVGFLITYQDKSLVYITDTGYINKKFFLKLLIKAFI